MTGRFDEVPMLNLLPLCRPVCWWHGCACDWNSAVYDEREGWRVYCHRCGADDAPYQYDVGRNQPEEIRHRLKALAAQIRRELWPRYPDPCPCCGHVGGHAKDCDDDIPF